MKNKLSIFISLLVLLLACSAANAQNDPKPIGYVQDIKGEALAISSTAVRILEEKDELFQNEALVTNKDSFIQAMFLDGTVLTLAENSRVELSEVVYDENDESKASFLVKPTAGVLRFLSGEIVKQNPDKYKVETPLGTIGIRGTEGGVSMTPADQARYNSLMAQLFGLLQQAQPIPRSLLNSLAGFQISEELIAHFQGSAYTPMSFTDFLGKVSEIQRGQSLGVGADGGGGDPGTLTPEQRGQFSGTGFNRKANTPPQLRPVFGGYSHNPGRNAAARCTGVGSGSEEAPTNPGDSPGSENQGSSEGHSSPE